MNTITLANKKKLDVTVSKNGLEYDMSIAPLKALYANERMKREYKDLTLDESKKINNKLKEALSIKIDRHRTLLPTILF